MVFDWGFERIVIPGNTSSQGKYVDSPTSVSATAGNGEATITFTLPTYDGKGTATYLVTANPGGATASGSSSPITVTGLSNGTAYTFTTTTVSGYGVNSVSASSNSVTPVAPPSFPPPFGPDFPPPFDPCAGRVCPNYPPQAFGDSGEWQFVSTNEQPWNPHCINAGYPADDPPYCCNYGSMTCGSGRSYWWLYQTADGCCAFNLYVYCACN